MRTLLVYHNPSREMLSAPPIGLAYVASAAADAGHEVRFLDLSRRRDPVAALAGELARHRVEVAAFSIRNLDNTIRQRLESDLHLHQVLIATARQCGATVVVGGPAVTLLGAASLDTLPADFAVLGEGEEAFPALLAALAEGRSPAQIPGVAWRDGERGVSATASRRLERFGASGLERWIDWAPYRRSGSTWPIQGKRGCALSCVYCSYPGLEGRRHRQRPAGEIVDEIERVARLAKPRAFEIVDSTFNVPVEPALELCRELRRRKLRVSLTAMGVNPLGVTEELFPEMEAAGFNSVMITPETASERMLGNLAKGFDRAAVETTAARIRRSRLASAWFFLLGGPGETEETVEETLAFIEQKLDWERCLSIVFTGIRVQPGTALAAAEVASGRLSAAQDYTAPLFYLSPEIREDWILRRIDETIGRRPNVVHAAEGSASPWQITMERTLSLFGVAPPYWRFYPRYLALPPIRALRRRFPFSGRLAV
ncbi:MAG: cobalamin-dependent protein [Holophagales bacterium]|nr:MAG: cobalamin-dependent protein [Holophagales bacterium]